jgi:hypothetical protein
VVSSFLPHYRTSVNPPRLRCFSRERYHCYSSDILYNTQYFFVTGIKRNETSISYTHSLITSTTTQFMRKMSSRILIRNINSVLLRCDRTVFRLTPPGAIRCSTTSARVSAGSGQAKWERPVGWILAGAFVTVASIGSSHLSGGFTTTSLDGFGTLPLGPNVQVQEQVRDRVIAYPSDHEDNVEEPETGIQFPPIFQSKQLLGLGARKKYQIFNVYAVGFYFHQEDFRGLPQEEQEEALLNPHKPRTIRIVMNRTLTMDKVISTLIQSLEPRMHGRDLFA